ncbi:MAG: prepilin peptidase [Candidatus Zixiibacteriota bacterium]|nr:MAG: prepilin peptidase [candidate division Zixibacteria bacterium]
MTMEGISAYIWIFCVGLVIGSFLNVLIYRIPRKLSFGFNRSFCPSCKEKIKFYDNIPVVSYIILKGKCRNCKAGISFRYPLVELLNGLIYAFLLHNFGPSMEFIVFCFLSSVLITIFFIDLDFQIIPDLLTMPGMAVGLGVSLLPGGIGIVSSLIGLAVGGGVLYLIALGGDWLFKKESMGGGDIKMAAMLGAFLGWQKVVFIFFAAAVIGLMISLVIMLFSKKLRVSRVVPFGPFLALGAFAAIVYGDSVIAYYISNYLKI